MLRFVCNSRYVSDPSKTPSLLETYVRNAISCHFKQQLLLDYLPVTLFTKSATKLNCKNICSNSFVDFEETHAVFPKNTSKACYIKGIVKVVDQQLLAEMQADGLTGRWEFTLHGELLYTGTHQLRDERIDARTGQFTALMS